MKARVPPEWGAATAARRSEVWIEDVYMGISALEYRDKHCKYSYGYGYDYIPLMMTIY